MLPQKYLTILFLLISMQSVIVKAAEAHSCYHCEQGECEDPAKSACQTNKKNDKCFIKFDSINNDVVQMGCLSQYVDQNDIKEQIKKKKLYVCDGLNCNDLAKLPYAIKNATIIKQQSCNNIPYTQYYKHVKDNATELGLSNDLAGKEVKKCLTGKCKIFEGKSYNQDVVSNDGKRCHRCSSETDASCESSPSALSVCPFNNETELCVVVFENEVTRRGCQTEFTCDYKTKNCHLCSTDGCNSYNIKRRFDDLYGIFQELPLNCNTCEGDECKLGKPRNLNKCEGDAYQDCMTVFDINGTVIHRGCEFRVLAKHKAHCDSYPELCFKCKANGCNDITSSKVYQECLYCDAVANVDCLFNPSEIKTKRKCTLGCVASLYNRKSNPKVLDFVRTCFEDIEPDNRDNCTAENNCIKCMDDNCNNAILPAESRLSCLHCNGSDCDSPTSKECVGYYPNDMCYIYFDDVTLSAVRMGCRSDISDEHLRSEIKQYFICDGKNCNDYNNLPEALFCTACDSKSDVNCAVNPIKITTQKRCDKNPYTQCYTRINYDNHTYRGCLSDLSTNNFINCHDGLSDSKCIVCTENNCNRNVYPYSRQRCFRCNSTTDANCEVAPNIKQPCPLYHENDACVTQWVNGITRRGCESEISCEGLNYKNCRKCSTNICNNINLSNEDIGDLGLFSKLPLHCYKCNGTTECAKTTNLLEVCGENIYQSCTTVFNKNKVIARGCSGKLENTCSIEGNICFSCKSNSCNVANNKRDYIDCVHCDSKNSADCIFNVNAVNRTIHCFKSCMTALYSRTDDKNPIYELVRSCLDDKDLNDRIKCESSKDPKCISCTNEKCNIDILGSRKSCYQCKAAECQSALAQTCRAVTNNDQCFMQYDERGELIELGCKSKYNPSEVDILVKQKRLWLCDDDNCNHIDNAPKQQSCVICNSRTDRNCAIKPNVINASTVCYQTPYTQCYSRVLNTSHTERGCISNLDGDELLNCFYKENNSKCSVCIGDKCNQEIFPADRRSCQSCNSIDDPACEYSPNFSSVCPLYTENEYCVTQLENGHTYRDCSTELQCDVSDKQKCRSCYNSDNCNTINLALSFVGDPGKWQELPLKCLHCNGKECSIQNGTVDKCEGNNLQTCMTVFNDEGIVVQRGCSDTVISTSSEYCTKNTDKCFACKSDECNNAKNLDDYIDCYFCDSSENTNCDIDFDTSNSKKRKCQKKCMAVMYPRNSRNDTSYELARTCLDDMNLPDREKCETGISDLCKACDGSLCNSMNVPNERLECYKCVDYDCEDMISKRCSSYHVDDQCYFLFNNESSVVAMGCRSEFEMDVVTELIRKKQLFLCNGKNCNAPESLPSPKFCSVCNSSENPYCATNPNLVDNIIRCPTVPYTQCFIRINPYGHTIRGCVGNLQEDNFYDCIMGSDDLCKTCIGDKCNELDVHPEKRRKCHQCDSALDQNCAALPNNNKVCELYEEGDLCVTNYHKGVTTRGCRSSLKCYNKNDPLSCRLCNADGCNTINMKTVYENGFPGRWQDAPISCYTCKGEEECSFKGDLRPCTNDPLRNCITVFNATSGKVFQRGCSDSVEKDRQFYCEQNPERCLRCNSNGCNEAFNLAQYVKCSYCDTDSNSNCSININEVTTTRQCYKFCMTALYPRFKEENPSYGLSRSCYDDMDFDDRELCAAGTKEHCKVCDTLQCNNIDMPVKRHRCFICEGDGCNDTRSQICSTYRPDDKCYIRFDERSEVVALGCSSQFSNTEADHILKQKRLFLCDGENCNTKANIPDVQTCVLCNSRTDRNCAVNANAVKSETKCTVKPFTKCYTRVLPKGATERGCLSSLDNDDFTDCLNDTSTTCQSCKGNNCNIDIFPKYRLKCHVCDSSTDPNCEASPKSLNICSNYDPMDTCVTAFRHNVTYRDCSSSLVCDETNPITCKKCFGEGCNTVNLAKKQDDNFGMWQDLPLTCFSCSGNECSTQATKKSLTCEVNNNQDCMTVFNTSGIVIARGCSDFIESEFCAEDEGNCFRCKSNNCNGASSKSDFEECVYCSSYNNLECIYDPMRITHKTRKCEGGCMTALYPSDSSGIPSYELIRTCLNDKELTGQKTCLKGKDKNCAACNGNKCNTNNIPDNRLSCYTCDEESCEEPKSKLCPLYRENDQCFVRFDNTNSVSEMGCISSFHNQDLENIIKTKRIHVCWGTNCNSLDQLPATQTCAVCNSLVDESCAVHPIAINKFNDCSMRPYTNCYTKLTTMGTIERGCVTDMPADQFSACVLDNDDKCVICNGNGCNREIFPSNRTQCFTCNSAEDPTCESFPSNKNVCAIFVENESCVTALSGNVTIRGCKSSVYCDVKDFETCRLCLGSECNSIDLFNRHDDGYHGIWQELPLKCHVCEGEHCLHSLGPSITCSKRNIKQDCMTVFDMQGQVEHRGCSDDVEDYRDLYCRKHPERCFKCKSNECNIAWNMEEYVDCLFCDSENDPLCLLNPNYSNIRSRKCYKNCMVAMKSEKIIRSCLDDKDMWMQQQCQQNNSNECSTCSGYNCNNFILPRNRLKCHVCTGSPCSSSESQYCEHYDRGDFCFAKYENGVVNLMGCASSQNSSDIAEWTAQNILYKCDSNDCNALSNISKAICISCDSSKNPNCAQSPSEISTTEVCMVATDKCFTWINNEGHTSRGCFNNLSANEKSCLSLGTCVVCTEEKCNSQVYPANRRECHICNSIADSNCKKNPSSLKVCLKYDANENCVSALEADGFFRRGCSSQVQCTINDSEHCNICDTNGCNTVELTDSTVVATNSISLTFLLAFASVFVLRY